MQFTEQSETEAEVTFERIRQFFHLPIVEASIMLKMDQQDIRDILKLNGIARWPYYYMKQKSITNNSNDMGRHSYPGQNHFSVKPFELPGQSGQLSPLTRRFTVDGTGEIESSFDWYPPVQWMQVPINLPEKTPKKEDKMDEPEEDATHKMHISNLLN
jgi:hypothetical protein